MFDYLSWLECDKQLTMRISHSTVGLGKKILLSQRPLPASAALNAMCWCLDAENFDNVSNVSGWRLGITMDSRLYIVNVSYRIGQNIEQEGFEGFNNGNAILWVT